MKSTRRHALTFAFFGLAATWLPQTSSAAPTLTGGTVSGRAGSVVTLPLQFNPAPSSVASLQFKLTLPVGISTVAVTNGSILATADKKVATGISTARVWSFIVYEINQNAIPSGNLVNLQLRIAGNIPLGALTIPISGVVYATPAGQTVTGSASDGKINVTLSGGSGSSVPILNIHDGDYVAVNSQISVTYTGESPASSYEWSFTPIDVNAGSKVSRVSKAGATGQTSSMMSSTPQANLSSIPLNLGPYMIGVRVFDLDGNISPTAEVSVTMVSADFSGVRVYPNPWRADKNSSKPYVTFDNLALNTDIKIFTVSGHWVKNLPTSSTVATWDLTNDSGDKVASGIYLYVLTNDQGQKKTGQIVVAR